MKKLIDTWHISSRELEEELEKGNTEVVLAGCVWEEDDARQAVQVIATYEETTELEDTWTLEARAYYKGELVDSVFLKENVTASQATYIAKAFVDEWLDGLESNS